MMLSLSQYKKILFLYSHGHSIRNIQKVTGHARNTIRRVKSIQIPPPRASARPNKTYSYTNIIKDKVDLGTSTATQIYQEIIKSGYDGSYSTVNRYICKLERQRQAVIKKRRPKAKGDEKYVAWVLSLLQGKISSDEVERLFTKHADNESISELYKLMLEKSLKYRNRSVTIFAYFNKIPKKTISELLGIERQTVRAYINKFESGGIRKLFDFSRNETKKYDCQEYKDKVFQILHSPPSSFNYNRTTWRLEDLYRTMKAEGFPLAKTYIHKIIKNEGYRFIKAKKVLTSNDPLYRAKLQEITRILSNLKQNEKFFSIDEFGPLAIKIHGGRSWTAPAEKKIVPQWQQSKGSLIITGALELSTNQITHFYSKKKNTAEMIALLEILLQQYKAEERIYFSWDAASWHASRELYKKVAEVNDENYRRIHNTPAVKLTPLPSSAQFLNVIESVFSGMAKAIIHNSNYASVEDCMAAIDRYFGNRNHYFVINPMRAGNKIWGKETTNASFSESNNCKDPRYR